MSSIRSYLLSRLLGGTALVLAAAGAGVYFFVTRSIEAQFDANLLDRVQGFASITFQVGERVELEFSDELMPEYAREELPAYFQVRYGPDLAAGKGELLECSKSLRGGDLVLPVTPAFEPLSWSAPLPDGRPGRYVTQLVEVHHVYPEEGPDRPQAATLSIVVARGREELLAAERRVLASGAALTLALMGLIALVAWMAVKRGLEPANRLAAALDAIQVERLPPGLDLGPLPSELAPVAQKTDALMRRVDTALERERRTTADIAHELRTPISEMLAASEVALLDERDVDGARGALKMVRDVSWRMGRSVSTLLELTRLEMGEEAGERERVDLHAVVLEALRSLAALERQRGLRVENRLDGAGTVEGERDVLLIVVSNLLSNALYYSPRGGTVECRLERPEGGWRLVVENGAPDLRPEELGVLSQPFWRKDRARTDGNRTGLGLALSRALAEKKGMELRFELEGGIFRALLGSESNGQGDTVSDTVSPRGW